jgi:flagellar protein FliL
VAEEAKQEAAGAGSESDSKSGGKPIVLYALVVLNMLVVAGVGAMLYMGKQKDAAHAQAIDKAAQGIVKDAEHGGGHGEAAAGEGGEHGAAAGKHDEEAQEFIGQTVPLETFLVNLSGNRGNKLLKVNMELEVDGSKVAGEIDKRKPQIRDIIIILLSSKTYPQLSSPEGREFLREEIRDTVNSFLTTGKIKRVLFTEFIFN